MTTFSYYPSFKMALWEVEKEFIHNSNAVHTETWQGVDIYHRPEAEMRELLHVSFGVAGYDQAPGMDYLRESIKPNLPWADDHFKERVCGQPLNPGKEWANWPWARSADSHRDENGQFNHNYMERYWPKYAGQTYEGIVPRHIKWTIKPIKGIRYKYGDLKDVVTLLSREPFTRQAYLPVWFPEDTSLHEGRRPCTLGYHFIMRENKLDIVYYIRSCDIMRHFRDDVYLTVRLQRWILERLHVNNPEMWKNVLPGQFIMHITSLHCFIGDHTLLERNHVKNQ